LIVFERQLPRFTMKKYLFILLFIVLVKISAAQTIGTGTVVDSTTSSTLPTGATTFSPTWAKQLVNGKSYLYYFNGVKWRRDILSSEYAGFPVTVTQSTLTVGATYSGIGDFLADISRSNPPTASLSGGTNIPITSASTTSETVAYSYGKQTGTQNIASATLNGSTSGITQNANGTSGTATISVSSNSFTTVVNTLLVTTVDSKTASATTSFTILNYRFWGTSVGSTPTTTEIQTATGGNSGLSNSKAGTFTITPSGTKYTWFAYPARFGDLTSISIGGAPYSWNKTTVSFTNSSGYVETYNVYTSTVPTAGQIIVTTT
jgi:hypothetical protein